MNIKIRLNDFFKSQDVFSDDIISMFICLQSSGFCYPEEDWVDNPEVILGWWTNSAIDLIEGGSGQGMCFMEGSFDINVKYANDSFHLNSEDGKISWVIEKREFLLALIGAYEKMVELYKELGVDNPVGFYKSMSILNERLHSVGD